MCSLKATASPKISERYASMQSEGEKQDDLGVPEGEQVVGDPKEEL